MENKLKIVLLTILTLSVLTIAVILMTGISDYSIGWWRDRKQGEVSLYDRNNNRSYHGEIYPDQNKTRDQLVRDMVRTSIQFYETRYSFGEVSQGRIVRHSFRFKNTGDHPLMIAKTDVSCGCTVPSFPEDAIAPGQEGQIDVEFNSAGKTGYQEKTITVHSNAIPESVNITIDADVK